MDQDARLPQHENLVEQLKTLSRQVLRTGSAAGVIVPLGEGKWVVLGTIAEIDGLLEHKRGGGTADAYVG